MKVKLDVMPQAEQDLITALWRSDEQTGGRPQLPPGQEELALAWFQRVVLDSGCLLAHVARLENLYGGTFDQPLTRWLVRDFGEYGLPGGRVQGFRHAERLQEAVARELAERGAAALSSRPDELAALLLNPLALWDFADRVNTEFASGWLAAIEADAQELVQREGLKVFLPGIDDLPNGAAPKQQPSP